MSKYKGNIVSATQTVLSGTSYTGQANGKFTLSEQIQARGSSLWAKGLGVPDAPTIGAAAAGNTQATVYFTAPSDTGGQTITGYTAKSNPSNITATAASSPITVTGLTNGTAYTFTVTATNVSGTGASSSASNSVTPPGYSVPDAPIMNSATRVTNNRATISISAPINTGGQAITGYTITSSPGNVTATSTTAGSIIITGLSPLTTYTFTATATNSVGTSAASSVSNSITNGLAIGDIFNGGLYGGKISTSANGVATHYLIVAPRATGQASKVWAPASEVTNTISLIDGPTNTTTLYNKGASYAAATFCKTLSIGGYTDWYLPAVAELNTIYYFLRPTSDNNYFTENGGINAYAVSPQPVNTNYTATDPTQTVAGINFRAGESEAFQNTTDYAYFTSTEGGASWAHVKYFGGPNSGHDGSGNGKSSAYLTRAIRRVPI